MLRAAVWPLTLVLTAAGVGFSRRGHRCGPGHRRRGPGLGPRCDGVRPDRPSPRRAGASPSRSTRTPCPTLGRRFVRESLSAQARFAQAAGQCPPGPLRDRLAEVGRRIDVAVRECWRVARLGAAVDAAFPANLDLEHTSAELRTVQAERHSLLAAGGSPSTAALDQTESALAVRLQAARRIQAAGQRATDRLRVVTAQLNEAVASAAEVSLGGTDAIETGSLAANIDSVVDEIESLRIALEETGQPRPQGPLRRRSIVVCRISSRVSGAISAPRRNSKFEERAEPDFSSSRPSPRPRTSTGG